MLIFELHDVDLQCLHLDADVYVMTKKPCRIYIMYHILSTYNNNKHQMVLSYQDKK